MKKAFTIIFLGSMWGIIEATLGYFLHEMSLNIGWLIWFPIAFYFMTAVYKQTGKPESILYISVIAATVKLIDLAVPVRIDKVLNPAVSILLEGAALFAITKLSESRPLLTKFKSLYSLIVSVSWRILYIGYLFLLPAYLFSISPMGSSGALLKFLVIESLANSTFVYLYLRFSEKFVKRDSAAMDISPAMAVFQLAVALFIQWVI